ncbi:DUF799 domain-containing protein [Janthinobacterium agaricidamnosum]|uniref:Lipoprotein n=1 Tax=Janthinobacterium agaricidamnosum NBRC 102515 = DSM 9628 TaxID=1349767 RepID=W0V1D5_9BURK|nr:GNA1162 family protein [Janthinobacterium agaricidamnosum]CDG81082.1 conserved hypothetical protein [Janthinobacterium agaricidamnosum NBRC 102515 = DSM 9628]
MMRIKKRLIALIGVLAVLSGCAAQKPIEKADYSKLRAANPHSVLVVPVVSRSVDVDAPDYFLSTIARPLAERGFYVFPINLVKRVMEDDGLGDADMVHGSDTHKLASMFGADSVLYVTIERWDSKYMVLSTVTTVELTYSLKSGSSGEELWKKTEHVAYDPSANSQNGFLGKLIAAAIEKAKPNYLPLAQQANNKAIYQAGQGLPAGPYDALYQKDQEQF